MDEYAILVNPKSTHDRNLLQELSVPYLIVYTGFDRAVDGALDFVKAMAKRNQEVKSDDTQSDL